MSMSHVRLVTVTCALSERTPRARIAAALFENPSVVAVRIGRRGEPSVIRFDVDAATDVEAVALATAAVRLIACELGAGFSLRSATAVLDSERTARSHHR
jgi:hypothetical protein